MKKTFLITAISLFLAITCSATVFAENSVSAVELSLKEKIQKVKDRSYVNDGVDNKIIRRPGKVAGTQLPSVLEMDGCGEILKYYVEDNGYKWKMYYRFEEIETRELALDYVEMLVEDYGCELKYEELGPRKSSDARHSVWLLEHSDSDIGKSKPIREDEGTCDVFIRLNEYYDFGYSTFAIYYVADLAHADAQEAETDDADSDRNSRKSCSNCGGDGRCNTCGGSGQVWKWAGDMYAYVRCTAFGCSGGRCTQCH